MAIQTVNPANGAVIATYQSLNNQEINYKIECAHECFSQWKKSDFIARIGYMNALIHLLEEEGSHLAHLMALEMGKPITQGKAEIEKCIRLCQHYIEHAQEYLADRIIQTEMKSAKVCHVPLGIIFGIMPWNFPFWQVFRFAVPTIMAGNAVILKHASISTGTGNKIEELFAHAGFPQALLQNFIIDSEGASRVIEHPHVVAVTLTGSERAGSSVAEQAGKHLKKSILELGGSDPYIILEDADLALAAKAIVSSRLNNSGQVCIAAKRIIALKTIEKELTQLILKELTLYKMGDPLDPLVQLGPMAREDLRHSLQIQVEKSVKQGAKLLGGGIIPEGMGFYYPPTLLGDVRPGMTAFDDELFGPVIVLCSAADEAEAIKLANLSQYGLGAAVFTRNLERGERIATQEIDAGVCFVNAAVVSDPRLPFGGIKQSGYGRELSKEGILEFVNTKTVVVSDLG